MKYFEVVYIRGGEQNSTIITSSHKIDAIKQFQSRALGVLVSIEEINEPFAVKLEKLKERLRSASLKKRVPLEPYIASLRQLGVMLDAGISLNQCFEEVVNTTEHKQTREIFRQIAQKIEAGESIGNAFEDFTYELGNVSAAIIKLGEQTGTLSEEVNKLANILEELHENRKKLKKALRYPAIVFTVMIIAFVTVIQLVVPQFKEMFEEYDSELPYPTQLLLGLQEFISRNGLFLLAGIVTLVALHTFFYQQKGRYKHLVDTYILRLYLIGKITRLSMTGRYIFVFNKLTNSGVPIIKALAIAENIIENDYLKARFATIKESIEEGRSLTEGFQKSEEFESMVIQMIKAGESSGSLNPMLVKVDRYYSEKYNDLVDNISTYIEPIMIVILAGFLTLLALGIFLPMWSMADVMDK
ncbi:MAG TPA: type II secretion system F family protein [Campylobacteraceae bacterium]|nr:type II secretion system F family protein [Campylobacteraceae bacterium]